MDAPDQKTLHTHGSVAEFFHEVLSEALQRQGVDASAHAEFYLVNLLTEFSHGALTDQPLALWMARAQEADGAQRLQELRAIGDHALYVSGFFADSLARKLIDSDYYISIGCSAYRTLAAHAADGRRGRELYGELSGKFPHFVDVLAEVSTQTRVSSSNRDLLRLYERYLKTGSAQAERQLRRLGLGVVPQAAATPATAPTATIDSAQRRGAPSIDEPEAPRPGRKGRARA